MLAFAWPTKRLAPTTMNGGGLLHTGQSWPGRPKRSVKPLPISAPGRPQLSAAKAEGRVADAANFRHEMVGKTTRIPQRQHPAAFNASDAVPKALEAMAKTSGGYWAAAAARREDQGHGNED